jgi:hypothetical protein
MQTDEAQPLEILRYGERSIRLRFTPMPTINRPILLVLHGQTHNAAPARFRSENWNVLCPLDNFGYEILSSWFLGEQGASSGWRRSHAS